jgi:DNA repair exonuclease SbcCD ATPase subunit
MTKERRERYIRSVKDKKSKVAKAKDKSACKQKAIEDLEAKTAAARAEYDAAKRNEDEATEELEDDKVVLEELEEQEKKIVQDLLEAENDLKILTEIEEHHKTAQGKAKLPLGGERAPEELRGAVEELVPSFQALCSDHHCPKETVKKALNFLFLNGVEGARMTPRAGDNIVLLRKQLANEDIFAELVRIGLAISKPIQRLTQHLESLLREQAFRGNWNTGKLS